MVEMYVSWVKGLPQDKEALKILRDNNLGVEMSNIDEQVEMLKDAGVRFSSHTPGGDLTLNLAKPSYTDVFEGEQGKRLLDVIRMSDAKTVGFHCGYSAEDVYKMKAYPNIPKSNALITNSDKLMDTIIDSVWGLIEKINGIPEDWSFNSTQKLVVLETLDYSRNKLIPWDKQTDEAKAHREEIEATVAKYGINAALMYVTEPDFIDEILDVSGICGPLPPLGFLFDVSHVFISADAKLHEGKFNGTIEDYFQRTLEIPFGALYQIHLTVPEGNDEGGYADHHHLFKEGDRLSDRIMDLAKLAIEKAEELAVVTLEMRTDLTPVEHAREMVKQAEYAAKNLNLDF